MSKLAQLNVLKQCVWTVHLDLPAAGLGAAWCVGQWERKDAGRRHNDAERTSRERRKESRKRKERKVVAGILFPVAMDRKAR